MGAIRLRLLISRKIPGIDIDVPDDLSTPSDKQLHQVFRRQQERANQCLLVEDSHSGF